MYKLFKIETLYRINNPLTYGFLVMPFILYLSISILMPDVYAFTIVIFIQSLFISFFMYGGRMISYRTHSMKNRLSSGNYNNYKLMGTLAIISGLIFLLSLLTPFIFLIINNHSLSWVEKNQFKIFDDNNTTLGANLTAGLDKDYLLFTSGLYWFFQFALSVSCLYMMSIALSEITLRLTKDFILYFGASVTIFILLILFSDIFTKNIYILREDSYTLNEQIIINPFWNFIKKINPFYWANNLLMNSTIADVGSGQYFTENEIFIPAYYNVFVIGGDYEGITQSSRPLILSGIKIEQLLTISIPIVATSTSITSIGIWEELTN